MADVKFSDFRVETEPVKTDKVAGIPTAGGENILIPIDELTRTVQLDSTVTPPAYSAYNIWPDTTNKCVTADTGFPDVRTCIGFEDYIAVYNGTGSTITDGTPVQTSQTFVGGVPSVVEADADDPNVLICFVGVVTADILNGEVGVATVLGKVNNIDTSALSTGPVYIASGGGLTNTAPAYPATKILVGGVAESNATTGSICVFSQVIQRSLITLDYNFTSSAAGAGTYYVAGSYAWSATDANLTQASTTVTYGSANHARGTHAGIVAGGAGTVDAGQVGLRVTGTSFNDAGVRTTSDSEVLTDDITTLTTDQYLETPKNWLGIVTFELYIVSGSPTTYSLDFNYGFSGYIDISNIDFTLEGIRVEGVAGANDSSFNVMVRKHSSTGWTYAATGFVAGNGALADLETDLSTESNLVNGLPFKWKRSQLNEFIEGSGEEGLLISVTTGANNSVQFMTIAVKAYSEELF